MRGPRVQRWYSPHTMRYGSDLVVDLLRALGVGARMDSEVLDLCLFDWRGRFRFLRHLRAGFSGAHLGRPGVTYLQARRITARGEQTWVQVDGELLGRLPMTFECVPAALSLIVP